jgi:plasmid stabilization system protein ParE
MRAQHMVDRITTRAEGLSGFPRSGRLVTGLEELEVRGPVERPYRIIYVVARDHIEILGVVHGSRDLL